MATPCAESKNETTPVVKVRLFMRHNVGAQQTP